MWRRVRRLTCGVPEKDTTDILVEAYYFADALRAWAEAQEEEELDG